jgi:molybdopterin-guanine dinucleotide biosynthesis protein A
MEGIAAFILAGGKSARMGSDKAFLELGGRPLIQHAVDLARALTPQVKIVGHGVKFHRFADVLPDLYPDHGPLGGIHAALRASGTDLNLILGVDMPFLSSEFLRFLADSAQASEALVTLPFVADRLQTLCAIYRKGFCATAERAIAGNRNKIDALFSGISVRIIDQSELVTAGFTAEMFSNLNTPEEWRQAQQDYERLRHL